LLLASCSFPYPLPPALTYLFVGCLHAAGGGAGHV
jgi:hypothetical protein